MSDRPTENAKNMFYSAEVTSNMARTLADSDEVTYKTMMADSLNSLAKGLKELSIGLRATYLLLEKLDRKR